MIMVMATGLAHAEPPAPVPAEAPAPVPAEELTLADDLIAAVGLRPITQRRVEALVETGTDATHGAAARATEKRGALGIELLGDVSSSDLLGARSEAAARIEHATERDLARLTASYGTRHLGTSVQSFATDARTVTYGGEWTAWRDDGRLELEAYGAQRAITDTRDAATRDLASDAYTLRAQIASRRVQALGLDHEFATGLGFEQASGTTVASSLDPDADGHMELAPARRHGRQRLFRAYIHDTIRVIESLDVHGGFVFEHWRWLSNIPPLGTQDDGEGMDAATAEVISVLFAPQIGAALRVTPTLALEANGYRRLRPPTWQQLMRPVQNGGVLTRPGTLRPATITGAELGPTLATGAIDVRAVAYWHEVDAPIAAVTVDTALRETTNLGHAREAGAEATASWRIARPWLLGASYAFATTRVTEATRAALVGNQLAQTPRHRAMAMIAYDNPRIVTVSGALRYVGARFVDDRNTARAAGYTTLDAMATRELTHGLAGYIAIENVLDRRYVTHRAGVDTLGAPRMVHVGLRLDSARW